MSQHDNFCSKCWGFFELGERVSLASNTTRAYHDGCIKFMAAAWIVAGDDGRLLFIDHREGAVHKSTHTMIPLKMEEDADDPYGWKVGDAVPLITEDKPKGAFV